MQSSNPYAAPKADVSTSSMEFAPVRVFSWRGRIGRLRYIAYSVGLPLVCIFAGGIIVGAFSLLLHPAIIAPVFIVGYLAAAVMIVLLTIQRAHDFNSSGWWALLLLIPFVNLAFCFI